MPILRFALIWQEIRFYAESLKNRNEIPIDGKISGLVEQGDEITWETLYKISQKTFVDETESSKKTSAGAGLTDND